MREGFYGYLDAVGERAKMKGQKLTKAQKKQQREEERRLREEEEARLQAEREEQERLERERKQREVEKLELKALERREDELNELHHLLEERKTAAAKWKSDAAEAARWERYLHSDGVPNPNEQQEVNSFVTSWSDDPKLNITEVFQKCHIALQLVEELEGLFDESTDPQKIHIYQEALQLLQELIHSKINLACVEILKKANKNIDIKTGNMEAVVEDEMMTLCLWANLQKSPSFKGLNFEEVNLSFQLPKQLVLSDIAVRILHTRYDHLTLLSRMAHPRTHAARRRSPAGNKEDLKDSSVQEAEEDDGSQSQRAKEEVQSVQESEGRKSARSRRSRKSSAQPSDGRRSEIFTQMEALDASAKESIVLELTPTVCDVQVVDLMEYTPLGGVFCYDLFHLPPQDKKAGTWIIQQSLGSELEVFPYPTAQSSSEEPSLVGVSVTLPNSVVFCEPPHVARWDAQDKQWRMDGITDVSFEQAEAKVSFKAETFQPFVLMQKTYVNLPFQSWELRPLGQDSARLSVNGALFNLSITVKDDECMLQAEQERGLSHVAGRWMSMAALQRAMFNAGVNIFVDEYTDCYVSSLDKDPLVERAAYEQMALCAASCAFSPSKWNDECGAERLVLQACEHLDPGPVPEGSWSLYLLGAQRSQKLELSEDSPGFSSDHHPGSEFHSTFLHMLQDNTSPEGIAKARKSHYLFVHTVQNLLWATRPLVYSGTGRKNTSSVVE
ncbi:dynein intermediate chain CFAP94, axonemal [Kryptolebias marmoratus]|uniref:dynein intermediate chain CFAP94, axonemal n=1 Tax=Kryptolebias marmoratus TaxID=37003 RepID=UPI0007F8EE44|nr:dynein intermediate chain CFAP94, axonemal [Kryptolebias marmoratus]